MKLASDIVASAELPSVAGGMALHVRVRDSADVAALDVLPTIAPVQARGSRRLSGAWLLERAAADATRDDDTERASRISELVLQRARQGRRFA